MTKHNYILKQNANRTVLLLHKTWLYNYIISSSFFAHESQEKPLKTLSGHDTHHRIHVERQFPQDPKQRETRLPEYISLISPSNLHNIIFYILLQPLVFLSG